MNLRIVPHVGDNGALELWAGSPGPAVPGQRIAARIGSRGPEDLVPLEPVFDGRASPVVSRTPIAGLSSGVEYEIFVRVGSGLEQRAGHLRTLPADLGGRGNPFRVLLASCFSRLADNARGAAPLLDYLASKSATRPHLKIWCGDQVYLDSPWKHYLGHTHTRKGLEERHLEHYLASWFAKDGLGASMQEGVNLFCSDDHELWNNAPFATPIARDTWLKSGRDDWLAAARGLYTAFQSRSPNPITFSVGPLSFCLADTRIDRDDQRKNLMTDTSLKKLQGWISGLRGPGALVLGQPLFTKPAGWLKGKVGDYALQNYAQFEEIAAALNAARHSVVILTGDVHYSRVAKTSLPSGATLAEAISSPLALVGGAAGKWEKAPDKLKLESGATLGNTISTDPGIETAGESVALVEFFTAGSRIVMGYNVWPTRVAGGAYKSSYRTEIIL
jgi:hypothetical protein